MLFNFDLQRFADVDDKPENTSVTYDDDVDKGGGNGEDVIEDDSEDVEDVEDDVEDVEDEEGEDESEDDKDDAPPKNSSKNKDNKKGVFTKEQQKIVDDIVQSRLERMEKQYMQQAREAAGVEVSRQEVLDALNLWGFLKLNPRLSMDLQSRIDAFIESGDYVAQKRSGRNSKEDELNKREAVLDLKASDPFFAKHSKKILEWAEDEGFEIYDAKSLRRAYLAYKGSQGVLDKADEEYHKQRQKSKTDARKRAKVATSKKGGSPKKVQDFKNMSDADILAASGLKLFTDD